jgi:hypothetical protein
LFDNSIQQGWQGDVSRLIDSNGAAAGGLVPLWDVNEVLGGTHIIVSVEVPQPLAPTDPRLFVGQPPENQQALPPQDRLERLCEL